MKTKATIYNDGKFIIVPVFTIKTVHDVRKFFCWLIFADLMLHPDDDFKEIVNDEKTANYLNKTMSICFDVCERENVDIYAMAFCTGFPELAIYQNEKRLKAIKI